MGRIPKVQKQKALEDEKAVQKSSGANDVQKETYRYNDAQSSPNSLDEVIEPPTRKVMKTHDTSAANVPTDRRHLPLSEQHSDQSDGNYIFWCEL